MEDYKKKYEQALDNFKKIKAANKDNKELVDFIEYNYPELKESKEEKMRNFISHELACLRATDENGSDRYEELTDAIAWLEKQTDANKEYWRGYREGKQEIIDKYSELEKQGEQKPNFCHHEVDFSNCSEEYRKVYYAGWNNCNQQHSQLKAEQKPTWSKENSCYYDDICEILINLINSPKSNVNKDVVQKDLDWLMSVKESQLKSAWSEEDERMFSSLNSIVKDWHNTMSEKEKEYYGDCGYIDWLKSLKEW